jgi:hypothetical protein
MAEGAMPLVNLVVLVAVVLVAWVFWESGRQ